MYYFFLTVINIYTFLCPVLYRPVYYTDQQQGYYCYSELTQTNAEPYCM